jgi:hypothetical protein
MTLISFFSLIRRKVMFSSFFTLVRMKTRMASLISGLVVEEKVRRKRTASTGKLTEICLHFDNWNGQNNSTRRHIKLQNGWTFLTRLNEVQIVWKILNLNQSEIQPSKYIGHSFWSIMLFFSYFFMDATNNPPEQIFLHNFLFFTKKVYHL